MKTKITIEIEDVTGGKKMNGFYSVDGSENVSLSEAYFEKARQGAQRVKELVAPVFAEKKAS